MRNDATSGMSLDLPGEMFRSGGDEEVATIRMKDHKLDTLVNVDVKFTDIDGLAVYEGDIVLGTTSQARGDEDLGGKGLGIIGEEYRWPDGRVPYKTTEALRPLVNAAIKHWEERTPIRFTPRTNDDKDYLSFEDHGACWSHVGRQGGEQVISLGTGCGLGSAIHEIGHALGLWHEQSRSDRDTYIEIIWDNVRPQSRHNFDKHEDDGINLGEYDFASIMHYPELAFSTNGEPTIRVKGGQSIGQRDGLSPNDVASVRQLYPDLDWSAVT